jgi:hypothetical protein
VAVIDKRFEEQVEDVEELGNKEHVPDQIEERDGALVWAADTVSRWREASSSRNSAMRRSSWLAR